MRVGGREYRWNDPPMLVAELGIAHGGSVDCALEMVDVLALEGCEAVKLQLHRPEEMADRYGVPEPVRKNIGRASLSLGDQMSVTAHARYRNLAVIATPFSVEAVADAVELGVDAIKVGSGELACRPILEAVGRAGRPVMLSTGMARPGEISAAVELLRGYEVPLVVMHCVSLYPTPYYALGLEAIGRIRASFLDCYPGYSDHAVGATACVLAVAHGARVIEKHVTLDGSDPDARVAIQCAEWGRFVEVIDQAYEAAHPKELSEAEQAELEATRRWAYHGADGKRPMDAEPTQARPSARYAG